MKIIKRRGKRGGEEEREMETGSHGFLPESVFPRTPCSGMGVSACR